MFDEGVFYFVSVFEDFAEGLMLDQMVLHVASQEAFEKFTLLRNEVARAGNHLAKPRVHLVLVLAPRHSVQFTELLDELVHGKHGRGQCLALLIDIFSTLNNLIIQNLVRINEISHFAAKYSAVGNHLARYSSLKTLDVFHTFLKFHLLMQFGYLLEFLCVIGSKPVDQER